MSNQPCKNPNCHSCGQPHPNCRCYSFADGGTVLPAYEDTEPIHAESTHGTLPKFEDTEPVHQEALPKFEDTEPVAADKYGTLEQQVKTAGEGALQGVLGPLAIPAEERFLGVKREDIAGRSKANPWTHGISEAGGLAGSMLSGYGEGAAIAKIAGAVPEIAALGKIGSGIIKGAIEGMSFAGSDEITKAMLNQPGSDPETPVSAALLHVGAAGLMGSAAGGIFSLGDGIIGKGIETLGHEKTQAAVEKYLLRVAETGDPLGKLGIKEKINHGISSSISGPLAAKTGTGWLGYDFFQKQIRPTIEKITDKPIQKANSYITDAIIKSTLENTPGGVSNAIHYATQIGKGVQKVNHAMDALFKTGAAQLSSPISEYQKSQLEKFIEDGQVNQQMQNEMQTQDKSPQPFAEGGMVTPPNPQVSRQPDSFSKIFPEQNTLLNAAKGRISKYLNSLRPLPNQPKLAFDAKPSDTEAKKTYNRALDFAVNPMKIMDHVNKGDLTPEDMIHFKSLYPEVHKHLSQEMTKRIVKAQLNDEKPSYTKRQSMSLFMGASLDGSVTPQAIQAAQGVFMQKQAPQQPPGKNKKGTSSLTKVSQNYQTDAQARDLRKQSQKN